MVLNQLKKNFNQLISQLKLLSYDSGWVGCKLLNGITGGVKVRRIGSVVYLRGGIHFLGTENKVDICTIPDEFLPDEEIKVDLVQPDNLDGFSAGCSIRKGGYNVLNCTWISNPNKSKSAVYFSESWPASASIIGK